MIYQKMSKQQVIDIINQLEKEWWEDSKGYNVPWERFASFRWLKELKKRINESQ